jgi:hypothetical protein
LQCTAKRISGNVAGTARECIIMSFKPEVIADNSGKFCGNAMAFATEEEARKWAADLSMRWTAVRDYRVVPSDESVNYEIVNGVCSPVKAE